MVPLVGDSGDIVVMLPVYLDISKQRCLLRQMSTMCQIRNTKFKFHISPPAKL